MSRQFESIKENKLHQYPSFLLIISKTRKNYVKIITETKKKKNSTIPLPNIQYTNYAFQKKKKNHKIVEKKNEMLKDFLFVSETLNIILFCIV